MEHKDWKTLIREVESKLQAIGMNLQGYKPTQSPSIAGDIRQKMEALEHLFQFIDSSDLPEKQVPRNMEIVQSLKGYLQELKRKQEAIKWAVEFEERKEAKRRMEWDKKLIEARKRVEAEGRARRAVDPEEHNLWVHDMRAFLAYFTKLVQRSASLKITEIAPILGLTAGETYDRLVKWAAEFDFTVNRQSVTFGAGRKDAFITAVGKEFEDVIAGRVNSLAPYNCSWKLYLGKRND